MKLNVFRHRGVAGLNQFLGDGTFACLIPLAGKESGGITLPDVRVDATYKEYVVFHFIILFCCYTGLVSRM